MDSDKAWSIFAGVVADVLEREPDEIQRGQDFRDDLEIDSLGYFELMLELEEAFDIDIDEDKAETMCTTDDGFKLVCSYLSLP